MVIEHLAFGLGGDRRKTALHRFFWSDHQSHEEEKLDAYKSLYTFDPQKPCLILVSFEHFRFATTDAAERKSNAINTGPTPPRAGSRMMSDCRKVGREYMNTLAPNPRRGNGNSQSSQASVASEKYPRLGRDPTIPKLIRAQALSRTGSKMGSLLAPPGRGDREDRRSSKDSSPAPPLEEDLTWKSLLDLISGQKKGNSKAAVRDGFCVLDYNLAVDDNVSFVDLAKDLRFRLEPFLSKFGPKQSLFILANGLAGLVVKQLLETTLPTPEKTPQIGSAPSISDLESPTLWADFYEKLQSISFFGTPHAGSVILSSKSLEREASRLLGFQGPLPRKLRADLTKDVVSQWTRWSSHKPSHLRFWYFHSHGFNLGPGSSVSGDAVGSISNKKGQPAKVNQSAMRIREGMTLLESRSHWDTSNKMKALEIIESVGGIAEFENVDTKAGTAVFLNCRFAECARVTHETKRQFVPFVQSLYRAAIRFAGSDQDMADLEGIRHLYGQPFVALTQLGRPAISLAEDPVTPSMPLDFLLKATMDRIPYFSEHRTMGKYRIDAQKLSEFVADWNSPQARLIWLHSPLIDQDIVEDCINQTFRSTRKGYPRFTSPGAEFSTRFEISPRPDLQPSCLTEGLRIRADEKKITPPGSPTDSRFGAPLSMSDDTSALTIMGHSPVGSPPRSPTIAGEMSRPMSMAGSPSGPMFGPLPKHEALPENIKEVVIPFLNFDSYFNLLKRRMVMKQRYRPSAKFDTLVNAVSGTLSRERLAIRVQKNMFCRRTLHQYTNPTRVDSHIKDDEQVFYRATSAIFKEKEKEIGGIFPDVNGRTWEFGDLCAHFNLPKVAANGLVLMVDQLCVWADPHAVVTGTTEGGGVAPGSYEDDDLRQQTPGLEGSFRESYEARLSSDISSISRNGEGLEFAAKLIHHALTLAFDTREPALDILKAFNAAIGECTLQGSHSLQDEKFETFKKQHTDYSRVMRKIQHLSEEVDSILKLLRHQLDILSKLEITFTSSSTISSFVHQPNPFAKTVKFVEAQERKFKQVDTHMHKLKEEYILLSKLSRQDASLFEQQYKRQRDNTSSIQGKQLFILTVVTVVFTPLSFCASLFGMNVEEWGAEGQPSRKIGIILGSVAAGVLLGLIAVIRTIKAPPDIQLMLIPLKWTWAFLVACWQLCSPINWWLSTVEYIRKKKYQESEGSDYYGGGRYSADGSESDHV